MPMNSEQWLRMENPPWSDSRSKIFTRMMRERIAAGEAENGRAPAFRTVPQPSFWYDTILRVIRHGRELDRASRTR